MKYKAYDADQRMPLISVETIQKTRQSFADEALGCIEDAISGLVKVNDLKSYVEQKYRLAADALAGDFDHTSILTLCHCGHVGIASSSHEALQQWYRHSFDAVGGMHERVGEMAISNPLNALGVARVRAEAADQARLARWRGYQKLHGEFEIGVDLAVSESRLRRGAVAALTITLAVAGIVWAVVR